MTTRFASPWGAVLTGAGLCLAGLNARAQSWTYQASSTSTFADGTATDTVHSHVFTADSPYSGYSLTLTAWSQASYINQSLSNPTLPSLTSMMLAPAADLTEAGVGIYNGQDNEIRNQNPATSYGNDILEISKLTAPQGVTLSKLSFILNSIDYSSSPGSNEGALVYGSTSDTPGATLTLLQHVVSTGPKDGYVVNLTGANFTNFTTFWVTSDNTTPSSVVFGNGTAVPEPSTWAAGIFLSAIACRCGWRRLRK